MSQSRRRLSFLPSLNTSAKKRHDTGALQKLARHLGFFSPTSSREVDSARTRLLACAFIMLGLLGQTGCIHKFRDRHPGYSLALDVAAPTHTNAANRLRVGFGRVKI